MNRLFLLVPPGPAGSTYATAVLALSPVGYWRMGEEAGDLADSSGNDNTATAHGTPTYGLEGALSGDSNTAISLSGEDADYLEVANSESVNTADVFSIVAWVKLAEGSGNGTIISRWVDGYALLIVGGILALFKSDVDVLGFADEEIVDTDYHMIAVTKDGDELLLYLDGVDATGDVASQEIVATGGVIQIGRAVVEDWFGFNGTLDEVAIFPVALSAANIAALYAAGT